MSITSAIVLYCSIWAVVFFMVLPFGVVSQHEDGNVVPGSPASAPSDAKIVRKIIITTGVAAVVFVIVWSVITYRVVTLDDFPFFLPPSAR